MLKIIFLSVFITATVIGSSVSSGDNYEDVRITFYKAIEDVGTAERFYASLASGKYSREAQYDAVLKAYLGAAETLLGKHYINPYSKYKHLKSGLEIIATAIKKDPSNLEIRFLRFSILHHLPGFLGYGPERDEDMKVIYRELLKKDYSALPYDIQKGIAEFLIQSGRISDEQVKRLNGLLARG